MFVEACFTLAILICTPLLWWYITLKKYSSLEKIPGPRPLPIIGNSNDVGKTIVDLLNFFINLRKQYGPVVKLWLGLRLHLVITKPEVVEYFLNSNTHLAKSNGYDLFKAWMGDGLLVSTGSKWRTRRKMITPTFHFKVLDNFLQSSFNKQISILLDILRKEVETTKESIDLHAFVNLCSLDIICETAFGTELKAQLKQNNEYVKALNSFLETFILRFFSGFLRNPIIFRLSKEYSAYYKSLEILHNFTNSIIKKRKEEFKMLDKPEINDDGIKRRAALLDMLLEASENGKYLSDEDIREEVDTFMFEGHDTSTSAICFTLYAIAENPQVQRKVFEELVAVLGPDYKQEVTQNQLQELKYLDLVIKEAIRVYPPVPIIERNVTKDCTVDGMAIPKDTTISIFLYGMNYSENVFPQPHVFDPERFLPENLANRHNFAYVPFSAGPRNCIGQRFALLELKATLAKFLRCFELVPDKSKPLEIGMATVLKSKTGLHVYLKPR